MTCRNCRNCSCVVNVWAGCLGQPSATNRQRPETVSSPPHPFTFTPGHSPQSPHNQQQMMNQTKSQHSTFVWGNLDSGTAIYKKKIVHWRKNIGEKTIFLYPQETLLSRSCTRRHSYHCCIHSTVASILLLHLKGAGPPTPTYTHSHVVLGKTNYETAASRDLHYTTILLAPTSRIKKKYHLGVLNTRAENLGRYSKTFLL